MVKHPAQLGGRLKDIWGRFEGRPGTLGDVLGRPRTSACKPTLFATEYSRRQSTLCPGCARLSPAAGLARLPPVRRLLTLLAPVVEAPRCEHHVAAGLPAELPELARGALVAMDQLVELERVDRPGIEAREAVTNVVKQHSELLLVVAHHPLAGGATLSSITVRAHARLPLGRVPRAIAAIPHGSRGSLCLDRRPRARAPLPIRAARHPMAVGQLARSPA